MQKWYEIQYIFKIKNVIFFKMCTWVLGAGLL